MVSSMISSERTVESVTGAETRLRQLVARGFQFVHPRDADGEVIAVVGVRVHHNLADVVQLRAENDVLATRIPAGERDVLAPATVLWQDAGEACAVLDALLTLPEDHTLGLPTATAAADDTGAPTKGCWLSIRPGHTKWLAATA